MNPFWIRNSNFKGFDAYPPRIQPKFYHVYFTILSKLNHWVIINMSFFRHNCQQRYIFNRQKSFINVRRNRLQYYWSSPSIPARTSSTFLFGCYLMMLALGSASWKKLRNVDMTMSSLITLRDVFPLLIFVKLSTYHTMKPNKNAFHMWQFLNKS